MNTDFIIGTKHGEDVRAGIIMVNGAKKGILLPKKSIRQPESAMQLLPRGKGCKGAISWSDGRQNTLDWAEAGSELAQWCLDRGLHLASQDELEIIYRGFKPGTQQNSLFARSGINISAVPPTYPYTRELPTQTALEDFRAGGPEAFDTDDWYWSSTRHPDYESDAYAQYFSNGNQYLLHAFYTCYGCAVRWIDLE
jgi:hypothetical protein